MYGITIPLAVLLSLIAVTPMQAAPRTDKDAVVQGDNEFAWDLYAKLRDREGNLFFSPDSISTALAMTYAGARGETAKQMASTLHFTLAPERLHAAFQALIEERNGALKRRDYELRVANALWGQKGFGFLSEFVNLTTSHYGAGLREIDFIHDTELARRTINSWVERQTRDKIKELLKPGILDSDTRLVLTNAIYFKGDWDQQFKKELTGKEAFHIPADRAVEVPMMHQTHTFKYADGGAFQILEMPYKGKELSMVVLLPRKVDGLAELETAVTAGKLNQWLSRLRRQEVVLSMPKFKTTSEFRLRDTLSAMGMSLAFSPGAADLSGMNGQRNLFIGDVVHQAYVDVNEEGTEAAAATGVAVKLAAAPVQTEFRADHPFMFLIRDSRSGSTLFLGRVVNPVSP
jgi:serpin B